MTNKQGIQEAIECLRELVGSETRCAEHSKLCGAKTSEKLHRKLKNTYEIALAALEKQVPVKPKRIEFFFNTKYECGCGLGVSKALGEDYCSNCGQKIDWGE